MPKATPCQKKAFFQAALFGNVEQVKNGLAIEPQWAQALDPMGFSALARAALKGHANCVKELLPASDPSIRVGVGKTLLMMAAANGNADCVSLLLPFCDPNAADEHGISALMTAAAANSLECVKALLPHCDPRQKDQGGNSAWDWAKKADAEECADFLSFCVASAERAALSEEARGAEKISGSPGEKRPSPRI